MLPMEPGHSNRREESVNKFHENYSNQFSVKPQIILPQERTKSGKIPGKSTQWPWSGVVGVNAIGLLGLLEPGAEGTGNRPGTRLGGRWTVGSQAFRNGA